VVGKIPFDEAMPKGLVAGLPVVEYDAQSPAARAIQELSLSVITN